MLVVNLPQMGRFKIVVLIFLITILATLVALFLIGYFRPKSAGLLVNASPQSSVYVDNEFFGTTPIEKTLEVKEFVLKIVPNDDPSKAFETKLKLAPGIQTTVRHEFGISEETSAGEILSFEKVQSKNSNFSVISIPDKASVSIDGRVFGFTPYKTTLTEGEHEILISLPNFVSRTFAIRTYSGYLLTAYVQLAREQISGIQEEEQMTPKLVEILETPNGFLRVRSDPSTQSTELVQIKPGETYPLIEEVQGWFKIESPKGSGWISSDYARVINEAN